MKTTNTTAKPSSNVKSTGTRDDKTCFLILGMHRSGTSALTRIISLAGAELPRVMIEATAGNRTGHWESQNLVLTNDRILEAIGLSWFDWHSPNWTALSVREREIIETDLIGIIEKDFDSGEAIVVKDPRICRLVPQYLSVFSSMGYRVLPVLIFRNPKEVIRSLMARSNWPRGRSDLDAALLWLAHTLEAEYNTRHLGRVVVSYSRMLDAWPSVLTDIEHHGDVTLNNSAKSIEYSIDGFLNSDERHHHVNDDVLGDDPVTLGWVRSVYEAMRLLEVNPTSAVAKARLDKVRQQIHAAYPVLMIVNKERGEAQLAHHQAEERAEATRVELAEAHRHADEIASTAEHELAEAHRQAEERAEAARVELAEAHRHADEIASTAEHFRCQSNEQKADIQNGFEQERAAMSRQLSSLLVAREDTLQRLLKAQDEAYRSSTSWRITAPLRGVGRVMKGVRNNARGLKSAVAMLGGVRPTLSIAMRVIRNQGVGGFTSRLRELRAQGYQLTVSKSPSTDNYVNLMAADRSSVLLSDWHIALTQAIWDDRPAVQDSATLGLSIVTHNSARWLPGFLDSLSDQGFPLSRLNVAVVDHESQDNSVDLLQAHIAQSGSQYASFTLHRRPNLGFGAGHDYVIRHLSDDFVLITNVDLKFHHNSLVRAQRAAMADRKDVAAWELRQCPYEHPKYYDPVTLEAVWNSHGCVLVRRQAYLEVGGYDDRIFMYGEDVELSYRFRGFGWRLRYLPQISVTHFVDLDDTTLRPTQLSGSLAANVLLRYRYGGDAVGAEGEALLAGILAAERNPVRKVAMIEAQTRIFKHREHFQTTFKPTHAVDFPFSGFDYIFARDGARVANEGSKADGNTPTVSVVTRTHGPKTEILREALASVINQSYGNIEHLVVEDRTDFARDLVEQVAEAYGREVRYLKSDGNGRSAAGNYGLSQANGEFLMLLDNDDLLFCDHVELLLLKQMAKPELVAAYSLAWEVQTRFDESGSYREVTHNLPPSHRFAYDRERLKDMNFIPIQAILFRRRLFENEGGFDVEIDHLEDWNLWSRYANHGDFEMIPKVTSMYRTPADPEIRDRRQEDLNSAYSCVKALNAQRRQELV